MRLLARLRNDVAKREVEVLAVVLPCVVPEHRQTGADGVFPHGSLVAIAALERMQLGDRGRFAEAHFDTTVRDEIERGYALGDAGRVVRRQLDDSVTEPDLLGPLARRTEEH